MPASAIRIPTHVATSPNPTTPTPTDAAITRMLTEPASRPDASDPALAGIAEVRAALDRALTFYADHRRNTPDLDLPDAYEGLVDAVLDTLPQLVAPTTLGGCRTLARLTLDLRNSLGLDLEQETPAILALIGGATTAAVPTPSPEHHLDAALLDLGRRFEVAETAYRAALRHFDEIEDSLVLPELPDAVFVVPGDEALELTRFASERMDDGRRWYGVSPAAIARHGLRHRQLRWEETPTGVGIARRVPWPEAQARADEIVAASDAWRAQIQLGEVASGLPAASELADRLGEALGKIETAIEDATALTFDGLLVKARFAKRDMEIGNDSSEALIRGLIRDLLAMEAPDQRRAAPTANHLFDRIVSGWRDWSALPVHERSQDGQAEDDRLLNLRNGLIAAADALPATLEHLPVKALAASWIIFVEHQVVDQDHDQLATDERLAFAMDTAIRGGQNTTHVGAAS